MAVYYKKSGQRVILTDGRKTRVIPESQFPYWKILYETLKEPVLPYSDIWYTLTLREESPYHRIRHFRIATDSDIKEFLDGYLDRSKSYTVIVSREGFPDCELTIYAIAGLVKPRTYVRIPGTDQTLRVLSQGEGVTIVQHGWGGAFSIPEDKEVSTY